MRTTAIEEHSNIVLVLERGMDCDGKLDTVVSDRTMSRLSQVLTVGQRLSSCVVQRHHNTRLDEAKDWDLLPKCPIW